MRPQVGDRSPLHLTRPQNLMEMWEGRDPDALEDPGPSEGPQRAEPSRADDQRTVSEESDQLAPIEGKKTLGPGEFQLPTRDALPKPSQSEPLSNAPVGPKSEETEFEAAPAMPLASDETSRKKGLWPWGLLLLLVLAAVAAVAVLLPRLTGTDPVQETARPDSGARGGSDGGADSDSDSQLAGEMSSESEDNETVLASLDYVLEEADVFLRNLFSETDSDRRMASLLGAVDEEEVSEYFDGKEGESRAELVALSFVNYSVDSENERSSLNYQVATNRRDGPTGLTLVREKGRTRLLWAPFYQYQADLFTEFLEDPNRLLGTFHLLLEKRHRFDDSEHVADEYWPVVLGGSSTASLLSFADSREPSVLEALQQIDWSTSVPMVARVRKQFIRDLAGENPDLELIARLSGKDVATDSLHPDRQVLLVVGVIEIGWGNGAVKR